MERFFRLLLQNHLNVTQGRLVSSLSNTAEEKYKFFLENHASLLQRVPLKQIATYLGMNEETLSRVRSRLNKKNA